MKMEQTEYSETSAYKIQTPGNYPEENIQHTEHGESLKSRKQIIHFLRIMQACRSKRRGDAATCHKGMLCEWPIP